MIISDKGDWIWHRVIILKNVYFRYLTTHYEKRWMGVNGVDRLSLILVIIGALNWLLIGLFRYDLVANMFGGQTAPFSRIIYSLVGLAGLYCISFLFREREHSNKV